MPEITPLATYSALLQATGHAPVVRFEIPPWQRPLAWRHGDAVAVVRRNQSGGRDLLGLGPGADLGPLLAELISDGPGHPRIGGATSTTIEQGNRDALIRGRGSLDEGGWYQLSARRGDLPTAGELVRAARLPAGAVLSDSCTAADPADAAELAEFLDRHHTSRWTRPSAMGGRGPDGRPVAEWWVRLREPGTGRLVAVGCVAPAPAGVPRIVGVAVDPRFRRLGLGTVVTGLLAQHGFRQHEVIELGVDHDHRPARRLYQRMGFTLDHAWWSEPIAGPRSGEAEPGRSSR